MKDEQDFFVHFLATSLRTFKVKERRRGVGGGGGRGRRMRNLTRPKIGSFVLSASLFKAVKNLTQCRLLENKTQLRWCHGRGERVD